MQNPSIVAIFLDHLRRFFVSPLEPTYNTPQRWVCRVNRQLIPKFLSALVVIYFCDEFIHTTRDDDEGKFS
jgi:hypothetical protein